MKEIDKLVNELNKIKTVKAAILFGSYAKGKQRSESDIDVCIISDKGDSKALEFSSEKYDISLFCRMPLYIQYRVFRDGKVLLCKDDGLLSRLKYLTLTSYLDEKYWRDKFVEKVLS